MTLVSYRADGGLWLHDNVSYRADGGLWLHDIGFMRHCTPLF